MTWECAILKTYVACGDKTDNEDIYKRVGDYYPLTGAHRRIDTRYGVREMLTHIVRSRISKLVKQQELTFVSNGVHRLTVKGKQRANNC